LIRIETLRDGNEPDSSTFKLLNVVQAIHKRASKSVELPAKHAIEFLVARVGQKAVQSRTPSLGTTQNVLINFGYFPLFTVGVSFEFTQLELAILVVS
jgi:hypothetical protein